MNPWAFRHFLAKNFLCEIATTKFGEKRGSGQKFLQWELSIYRGEGGSFQKTPRFDRCEVSGGRVSTLTFRGWRFLLKFKIFLGIGSSESTRFPEGLVLGNSGKTCHPRNAGFVEIHEISFQVMFENDSRIRLLCVNMLSVSGWLNLWRPGIMNMRNLEVANLWRSGIHEHAKPWSRESVKIWNYESVKPWSCKSMKIWNHESARLWSHEPAKLRNRESAKFGDLQKSKFRGYGIWRFPWIRDSWISKKPSQNRYLKSPGLMCELVAGL
jgi:hypothetical protein